MTILDLIIGEDQHANPWQMCARAVILFVFGLICIRIAGRRTFAQATPLDIVVALVVGSNISRMMTGNAKFVGGILATLVLVLLHRAIAMATLKSGLLNKLIKSPATDLVREGVMDLTAMRRHGLSEADLHESLRLKSVEEVQAVKRATLEAGGEISVIRKSV